MKSRSLKPAVLVLAAVLILALLAAIVITQTARSRAEQAITLPGASYAPEELLQLLREPARRRLEEPDDVG